jgi:hypothetical protein
MKAILLLSLFSFLTAHAESQLSCWDKYAKSGSKPFLTAQILAKNALKVTFDLDSEGLQRYVFDESTNQDRTRKVSEVFQPKTVVKPTLNVSNRSPYKGNNEYAITFGQYSYLTYPKNQSTDLVMRLVLPTDLSSSFLKNYRIRNNGERSNAVIITAAPDNTDQAGNNFFRLFCTSK